MGYGQYSFSSGRIGQFKGFLKKLQAPSSHEIKQNNPPIVQVPSSEDKKEIPLSQKWITRRGLLIAGSSLYASSCLPPQTDISKAIVPDYYRSNYANKYPEGQELFKIDNRFGIRTTDRAHQNRNKIIDEAKAMLEKQGILKLKKYNELDANIALEVIGRVIEKNIIYDEEQSGAFCLSYGFDALMQDCNTLTRTYESVIKALGLPLKVYKVPLKNHSILSCEYDSGKYIDWECVSHNRVKINDYKTSSNPMDGKRYSGKTSLSYYLHSLSSYFYNQKEYTKSLKVLSEAIKLNPKDPDFYSSRSVVFSALDQHAKAISDGQKALSIDSKNPDYYSNMGTVLCKSTKYKKALTCYNKAISMDRNNGIYYYNRHITYKNLSLNDLAKRDLDKARILKK